MGRGQSQMTCNEFESLKLFHYTEYNMEVKDIHLVKSYVTFWMTSYGLVCDNKRQIAWGYVSASSQITGRVIKQISYGYVVVFFALALWDTNIVMDYPWPVKLQLKRNAIIFDSDQCLHWYVSYFKWNRHVLRFNEGTSTILD